MTKAVRSQILVTRSAMRSRSCAAQMRRVARLMVLWSERPRDEADFRQRGGQRPARRARHWRIAWAWSG